MRARDASGSTASASGRSGTAGGGRPLTAAGPGASGEKRADERGEERLIAEIGHELGNYFHKLYYWIEFLQEKRADQAGDAGAADMLGHTVEKLEGFLKQTLECFRPIRLSPVPAPVPDVVAAMVAQLRARLQGWPVHVADVAAWRHSTLSWDPGRMHAVLGAIATRLTEQSAAGTGVQVGLEGRGSSIEVMFRIEGGFGLPEFRSGVACLEWALAERIVWAHHGRLFERRGAGGETALTLELPFSR